MRRHIRPTVSISLLFLLSACTIGPGPFPGFDIGVTPDPLRLQPGGTATVTITVIRGTFDGSVSLDTETLLPQGLFIEDSEDPGTDNRGSVTLLAEQSITPDTYMVAITAAGGEFTRTLDLTVIVGDDANGNGPGGGDPGRDGGPAGTIRGEVRTANAAIPIVPQRPGALAEDTLATAAAPSSDQPDYVPGQVLVKYRDDLITPSGTDDEDGYVELARGFRQDYDLTVLEAGEGILPDVLRLPASRTVEEAVAELSQDPRVAYAEPNVYLYPLALPNDPELNRLWHLPVSGVPVAWGARNEAASVTVAVIDSGIDVDHPDLAAHIVSMGYDFCNQPDCAGNGAPGARPENPADNHGTAVTGMIAAVGNNGQGVAGVLYGGAGILPVKVFRNEATPTTASALARAIRWAAGLQVSGAPTNPNQAQIINLSLGANPNVPPESLQTLQGAVTDAQAQGVLIVAAAGNSGAEGLLLPAGFPEVLSVGSVNSALQRSCFSNFGSNLDLMAAGGNGGPNCPDQVEGVFTTFPQGTGNPSGYGLQAGTSFAAPIVSGVAALVWAENPNFSQQDVIDRLKESAYQPAGYSENQFGAGIVRADVALGFPAPEAAVSIIADGGPGNSGLANPTLDFSGVAAFTISGLQPGSITLEADITTGRGLSSTLNVPLSPDIGREGVVLGLE